MAQNGRGGRDPASPRQLDDDPIIADFRRLEKLRGDRAAISSFLVGAYNTIARLHRKDSALQAEEDEILNRALANMTALSLAARDRLSEGKT